MSITDDALAAYREQSTAYTYREERRLAQESAAARAAAMAELRAHPLLVPYLHDDVEYTLHRDPETDGTHPEDWLLRLDDLYVSTVLLEWRRHDQQRLMVRAITCPRCALSPCKYSVFSSLAELGMRVEHWREEMEEDHDARISHGKVLEEVACDS